MGSFFSKLWAAIKKILVYILLIIAAILIIWSALATGGATLAVFGFTFTMTQVLIIASLCIVGAFVVDPDTAKEVVGSVGEAIGEAAGAIAAAAGAAAGGAALGFLSSPVGLAVAGFAFYWFFVRDTKKEGDAEIDRTEVLTGSRSEAFKKMEARNELSAV